MQLKRIFLDTNVLISGIVFNGNESRLIRMALLDDLTIVVSDYVIEEARRVIAAKFPAHLVRLEKLLALLEYELAPEPSADMVNVASETLRDPGDVSVLASILSSQPDIALSGDKDLLTEEVKRIAPVCKCADYLRSLTTDNR